MMIISGFCFHLALPSPLHQTCPPPDSHWSLLSPQISALASGQQLMSGLPFPHASPSLTGLLFDSSLLLSSLSCHFPKAIGALLSPFLHFINFGFTQEPFFGLSLLLLDTLSLGNHIQFQSFICLPWWRQRVPK